MTNRVRLPHDASTEAQVLQYYTTRARQLLVGRIFRAMAVRIGCPRAISRPGSDAASLIKESSLNHPLLDLRQFTIDHPPRDTGAGPWPEVEAHCLQLRAAVRIRLAVDRAREVGYGLSRVESLDEANIMANDVDSLAFANQLLAALGPHLTRRNVKHIIQVFAQDLAAHSPQPDDLQLTSQPPTMA